MYLYLKGSVYTLPFKNKMESNKLSSVAINSSSHVKVNTRRLPLVSYFGSSVTTATIRLTFGIRNFSTKPNIIACAENKLNVSPSVQNQGQSLVSGPGSVQARDEEFLFWFAGFTDGEGNFSIILDGSYIRFRFKINLHIDDLQVLKIIKSKLKIGNIIIEENRNSCAFVVQNFSDLKNVLCPIFINFPLLTSKKLDFQDFYNAILIKAKSNNGNLSSSDKIKILSLKDGMNLGRTVFKYDAIGPQITINPNWLVGFIEAEGTFGIKTGSSLYFQVAQKITSQECLNAIITFLTRLYNTNIPKGSGILPVNVTSATNIRTSVVSLVISSVDALYYHLLPWLDSSKFYSRKHVDFKLWRLALLLKIKGYYYLTEGKSLFLDIADIINKRYSTSDRACASTNIDKVIGDLFERFNDISKIESPFNIEHFNPHVDNALKFRIANKSDKPRIVYIYTNEGLMDGSPFASFSLAHKALGLKSSSNTCNRYLDTNRLYKGKYLFSSKPVDSASRS